MDLELSKIIHDAINYVTVSPLGILPLGYRWKIYKSIGPQWNGENEPPAPYYIRCQISSMSVNKVISLWKEHFPSNNIVSESMAKAKTFIEDQENAEECGRYFESAWFDLGELYETTVSNDEMRAVDVGYCALMFLFNALTDIQFDEDDNLERSDDSYSPEDRDAAFFASCAYAKGSVHEPNSSPSLRREFWLWWLREAIPTALKSPMQ